MAIDPQKAAAVNAPVKISRHQDPHGAARQIAQINQILGDLSSIEEPANKDLIQSWQSRAIKIDVEEIADRAAREVRAKVRQWADFKESQFLLKLRDLAKFLELDWDDKFKLVPVDKPKIWSKTLKWRDIPHEYPAPWEKIRNYLMTIWEKEYQLDGREKTIEEMVDPNCQVHYRSTIQELNPPFVITVNDSVQEGFVKYWTRETYILKADDPKLRDGISFTKHEGSM